jgi:hypothetical protein
MKGQFCFGTYSCARYDGKKSAVADMVLKCCGAKVEVSFRHFEAPALLPNQFRKNIVCTECHKMIIVTLTKEPSGEDFVEQEVLPA